MKKRITLIAMIIAAGLLLVACNDENTKNNKLKVYTTNFPYESFIDQIGGEYVDTKSIYPSGTDLHNYEPTQKEMINIAKSDLFVYSSDELDTVSKKISTTIKNEDYKLEAIPDLKESDLLDHHHEDGEEHHNHDKTHEHDPHIWLDPIANKEAAKNIKNKLIELDPKHESIYEKNYKALIGDISSIDQSLKVMTENSKRNTVYISHDSLGYLANRYHFEQVGITGMNNEEPSQKEILNIIEEIRKSKANYILYEQNVSSKITDIIKKDTDQTPLKFHNLEVLTKKESEQKGVTYQSLMKENISVLNKALNE